MKLNLNDTKITDCVYGNLELTNDTRGCFKKFFQRSSVTKFFPEFDIAESYMTTSKAGVLRGMHFQAPPYDHEKIVICLRGHVKDVVLDLRNEKNFGRFDSIDLTEHEANIILIPKGVAHGFYAYEDSQLLYFVSTEHSPLHDLGIKWNSFGVNWPTHTPIMSERDNQHENFNTFVSPF